MSEPAAIVNVATYEIVSSVGVRNVRRVVLPEDGQAKSDRGD